VATASAQKVSTFKISGVINTTLTLDPISCAPGNAIVAKPYQGWYYPQLFFSSKIKGAQWSLKFQTKTLGTQHYPGTPSTPVGTQANLSEVSRGGGSGTEWQATASVFARSPLWEGTGTVTLGSKSGSVNLLLPEVGKPSKAPNSDAERIVGSWKCG
jgi:hypothetical protein